MRQELGVGRRKFNVRGSCSRGSVTRQDGRRLLTRSPPPSPASQVTAVGRELNLDRGEVLAWLKQNARSAPTARETAPSPVGRQF